MGIYRSEIADLKKYIGDNIGQKIIVKELLLWVEEAGQHEIGVVLVIVG